MTKKINPTVNYTNLITALNLVTKRVSKHLDTPVHFAILFGDDCFDEVLISIEYHDIDFQFDATLNSVDLHNLLTEYGTEKFVKGLVKTIMEDSMKEFLTYLYNKR